MSKNYLFYCLFAMLFLMPGIGSSQETIKFGTTRLNEQIIELKKIKCKVTPKIEYDTNNRQKLSITLMAEWYDKNGEAVKNAGHYLFMIENPVKFIQDNKANLIMPNPGSETKLRTQKPPKITENDNNISHIPFTNGYSGFQSASEQIILQIAGSGKNIIVANFYFAYLLITGSKKELIDADLELSWTFTIPEKPKSGSGCETKTTAYNGRLNMISKAYKSMDIEALLNKPGVQPAELENKRKECNAWIETANKLNDSISSDAVFINCHEARKTLSNSLNTMSAKAMEDEKLIIAKIGELRGKVSGQTDVTEIKTGSEKKEAEISKTEPLVTSDLKSGIAELKIIYEGICNELSAEFTGLKKEINAGQSGVQTQLTINSRRITAVRGMIEKKAQLSADSLIQMSEGLKLSKTENQANDNSNQAMLNQIREFKSRIEREKSLSASEFRRLDKKAMPPEGKIIQAKLENLYDKASALESGLDVIMTEITRQNSDISRLIAKIQGNEGLSQTIELFDKGFNDLISKLVILKINYQKTSDEFENQKFSKWYFKWGKEKLLAKVDEIKRDHAVLMHAYDSLVSRKIESFRKFDFDPLIISKQEFDKSQSGFDSRVETLRTNILEWDAMPFPYLKSVLALVILSILIFGFIIYFRALRKKKIIKTIIKPAEKSPKKTITLQNTELNLSTKGKGLLNELKTSKARFLELDLSGEWDDSMVKKVYFERNCIIKTYRFFEDSIHSAGADSHANETGGFLIG